MAVFLSPGEIRVCGGWKLSVGWCVRCTLRLRGWQVPGLPGPPKKQTISCYFMLNHAVGYHPLCWAVERHFIFFTFFFSLSWPRLFYTESHPTLSLPIFYFAGALPPLFSRLDLFSPTLSHSLGPKTRTCTHTTNSQLKVGMPLSFKYLPLKLTQPSPLNPNIKLTNTLLGPQLTAHTHTTICTCLFCFVFFFFFFTGVKPVEFLCWVSHMSFLRRWPTCTSTLFFILPYFFFNFISTPALVRGLFLFFLKKFFWGVSRPRMHVDRRKGFKRV